MTHSTSSAANRRTNSAKGYKGTDSAFSGIHNLVHRHLPWMKWNDSVKRTGKLIRFYLKDQGIEHHKYGSDANARIIQQDFKRFREWFFEMIK